MKLTFIEPKLEVSQFDFEEIMVISQGIDLEVSEGEW